MASRRKERNARTSIEMLLRAQSLDAVEVQFALALDMDFALARTFAMGGEVLPGVGGHTDRAG